MHYTDPVEVLVRLDRHVYEWLEDYTASDAGDHPLTSSVEVTVATLIKAAARKGITLDWLEKHIFANGSIAPLKRTGPDYSACSARGDLSFSDSSGDQEFCEPAVSGTDGSSNLSKPKDFIPLVGEHRKPKTPRERGVWPAGKPMSYLESVDVLITLERDTYDWMENYLVCEAGTSSFTGSFGEAVNTLIQAAAQSGITLGWIADTCFIPSCCKGVELFEECPNCNVGHLEKWLRDSDEAYWFASHPVQDTDGKEVA